MQIFEILVKKSVGKESCHKMRVFCTHTYSLLFVQLTTLDPIKAKHVATILYKYGICPESIYTLSRKDTDDAKLIHESGN